METHKELTKRSQEESRLKSEEITKRLGNAKNFKETREIYLTDLKDIEVGGRNE